MNNDDRAELRKLRSCLSGLFEIIVSVGLLAILIWAAASDWDPSPTLLLWVAVMAWFRTGEK